MNSIHFSTQCRRFKVWFSSFSNVQIFRLNDSFKLFEMDTSAWFYWLSINTCESKKEKLFRRWKPIAIFLSPPQFFRSPKRTACGLRIPCLRSFARPPSSCHGAMWRLASAAGFSASFVDQDLRAGQASPFVPRPFPSFGFSERSVGWSIASFFRVSDLSDDVLFFVP